MDYAELAERTLDDARKADFESRLMKEGAAATVTEAAQRVWRKHRDKPWMRGIGVRGNGPYCLEKQFEQSDCPVDKKTGERRRPKLPGFMRAAMANAVLDPVERARDGLLMLVALGPD